MPRGNPQLRLDDIVGDGVLSLVDGLSPFPHPPTPGCLLPCGNPQLSLHDVLGGVHRVSGRVSTFSSSPPLLPTVACRVETLSYVSTISFLVCIVSAGYLLLTYAGPVYHRVVSRRGYSTITGTATATAAATTQETRVGGDGGSSASVQSDGATTSVAGGSFGRSGQEQEVAGGSRGGGPLPGDGWRAYGSTDEAPAGAGCLPPAAR